MGCTGWEDLCKGGRVLHDLWETQAIHTPTFTQSSTHTLLFSSLLIHQLLTQAPELYSESQDVLILFFPQTDPETRTPVKEVYQRYNLKETLEGE